MSTDNKIMNIRKATSQDAAAIEQLHLDAFGPTEGPVVAKLSVDLLTCASMGSASVFLALKDEPEAIQRIVGCVIFSEVRISGHDHIRGAILAPLAVETAQQRTGIGRSLVKHGLDAMSAQTVDLVLVYGDPQYYSRFGFGVHHQVHAPYPLQYPDAWMALELTPGVLTSTNGTATCVTPLQNPVYW